MLTEHQFLEELQKLTPNFKEKSYLLAVSGGVDSMVLCELFRSLKLSFQVVHINYHFRGEDSNLDQKLVEEFCTMHSVKFHLYDVTEEEKKEMKSLQTWARKIRYQFFRKIQKQQKIDFLVTAHHLNDQLETFFINLSRASGIKGLSGIPENTHHTLRPLLIFSKKDIYEYAEKNRVKYREDFSNQKNDYLRNQIRNEIIPRIIKIQPNFLSQFQQSLENLAQVNLYYQDKIEEAFLDVLILENENEWVLNKEKLLAQHESIKIEIIRKLGFSGDEIQKLLLAENGKMLRSSTFEVYILKKEWICKKRTSTF